MRQIIGLLIIILGIFLGLYLGVWVMFIGGVVNVINGIKANPVEAMLIGKGLAKMICANIVGWVSFMLCFVIGGTLLSEKAVQFRYFK